MRVLKGRVLQFGYYSVTGGFYLDDISVNTTVGGQSYALHENWDDSNWTTDPQWHEYDNPDHNFRINSQMGHTANPCLEAWGGNTGTDYTALFVSVMTSSSFVKHSAAAQATEYEIGPNYPNPFNATTRIPYTLNAPAKVELHVFNVMGEEVFASTSKTETAGEHHFNMDSGNWATGVYPYQVTIGSKVVSGKMMLLK